MTPFWFLFWPVYGAVLVGGLLRIDKNQWPTCIIGAVLMGVLVLLVEVACL